MTKSEIIKQPIERISTDIKRSAWAAIFESLALILLGILFLVLGDTAIQILTYFLGAFFIVKGGYQIVYYFIEKGQSDFLNNNLFFGIVSVLVGIAFLLVGPNIASVFRIIIGVILIYESLIRINTSVKLHAAGIDVWKYILIAALIMLVLGIFVTFYSAAIVMIMGWVMIASGLIGIVADILFIQNVNKVTDALTGK